MRKFVTAICLLLCFYYNAFSQQTIYDFSADTLARAQTIALEKYRGKKLLIIVAASNDSAFTQYSEIAGLAQLFKDSLEIIVFPTNSFNTETTEEIQLKQKYNESARGKFTVSSPVGVKGKGMHPLFNWLSSKLLNGVADAEVRHPFQKYLISKEGKLVGIFNYRVNPLSPVLINAIRNSQ